MTETDARSRWIALVVLCAGMLFAIEDLARAQHLRMSRQCALQHVAAATRQRRDCPAAHRRCPRYGSSVHHLF